MRYEEVAGSGDCIMRFSLVTGEPGKSRKPNAPAAESARTRRGRPVPVCIEAGWGDGGCPEVLLRIAVDFKTFLFCAAAIVLLFCLKGLKLLGMIGVEFFKALLGIADNIKACVLKGIIDQIRDGLTVFALAKYLNCARKLDTTELAALSRA